MILKCLPLLILLPQRLIYHLIDSRADAFFSRWGDEGVQRVCCIYATQELETAEGATRIELSSRGWLMGLGQSLNHLTYFPVKRQPLGSVSDQEHS